jgi:hypothetical protein
MTVAGGTRAPARPGTEPAGSHALANVPRAGPATPAGEALAALAFS